MRNLDRETIVRALDVAAVLSHFNIDAKRRGHEYRTSHCFCGERSTDAVCINAETGKFDCKGKHASDILTLIAGHAGLDVKREFPAVLKLAATIAGLDAEDPIELERRITERLRRDEYQRHKSETDRATRELEFRELWPKLERTHFMGLRYFQKRGIDGGELRAQGDVVRYMPSGDPALPLRSLTTGEIVGIQHRRVDGAEPKAPMLRGSHSRGAALSGRLSDLDPDGVDVAVIVEGFTDTCVARLAWPGCAVFGAAGADQLARIAAAVARRVLEVRGWLLLVPHDDDAGVKAGIEAVHAAQGAGLVLHRNLLLVDVGEVNDLADAWLTGWRWSWPTERGGVG